jgi:mannonate dehydratase
VQTVKPTLYLPSERTERWDLARQMGITHAVTGLPRTEGEKKPWAFDPLLQMNQRFADNGFDLRVIEARPPMDDIMLDGPKREEQIEDVCQLLRNMGRVGIPVWCSAWMPTFDWLRTSTAIPDRGGSLVTGYDHSLLEDAPTVANVSEKSLWENITRFIERTGPVAEEAGVKMALHPDDPPLSPVRGVGRIVRSVEAYDRILDIYPSEYNGLTFCQGNFVAMGCDIPEAIDHFGDRINFVHFRDVEGTAELFRETWHDAGPTDMLSAIRAYRDAGFEGSIRPDHVPTMAGESNENPGYQMKGRLFAIGYLKGLMEQTNDV